MGNQHVVHRGAQSLHAASEHVLLSSSVAEYERLYEKWINEYLREDNQVWGEAQTCRVYRPEQGTLVIHFCQSKHPKGDGLHRFLGALKSFTFVPQTPVSIYRQSCSDWHALLSDWAMAGADLYNAVKQYKISAPSVDPATSESETASTR
jgi:hypothetical protein